MKKVIIILSLSLPYYIYSAESASLSASVNEGRIDQKKSTKQKSFWKNPITYLYAIAAGLVIADVILIGSRYTKDAQLYEELKKRISTVKDIAVLQKVKQEIDKWPESNKKKELQELIAQRMTQLETREQEWKGRLTEAASNISSLESLESASQEVERRIPGSREAEITQEVIAERRAEVKRQTNRQPGRG